MTTSQTTSSPGSAVPTPSTPPTVAWTQALEQSRALDPLVSLLRPFGGWFVSDPARRDLLQGAWLGHAVHPPLTDVPIGLFTSALTLDLIGGEAARPAARRLIALGLVTALPTFWTGWAEWAELERRDQRVGVVHALANGTAAVGFAASWRARHKGQHFKGVALGLASASLMGAAGYLGGHLISARKASTHHPAFDQNAG
jgi:uncharacterized membrane protein